MQVNVSTNNTNVSNRLRTENSLVILGKANTDYLAGEIVYISSSDDIEKDFGVNSSLANSYNITKDLGVNNVYLVNCYNESDYIKAIDKLIQYDFTYIAITDLYMSDKFYNSISKKSTYYLEFILSLFKSTNTTSTLIATDRHSSLYEDIDHYLYDMKDREYEFKNKLASLSNSEDLIVTLNNIRNVAHSNIVLACMLLKAYPSEYPKNLSYSVEYDVDKRDLYGLNMVNFKFNHSSKDLGVENLINYRREEDIYKNVIINRVIKATISKLNFDKYKGLLFNTYVKIQIENEASTILNKLKGSMFKEYTLKDIKFIKTGLASGCICIAFSIIPYGTFDSLDIIMEV